MLKTGFSGKPGQEVLRQLSEGLLRQCCRSGLQSDVLHIHHGFAPALDPELLHSRSESFGVAVHLNQGREALIGQRVHCDSGSLPFQDRAFSMVLLHHVIADGTEPELEEASRVLARDGVLVLLGLNRLGWRYRFQGRFRRLPGLSPFKVKTQLERLEMNLEGCFGAGLMKRQSPVFMGNGLSSMGLPVADVVVMRARHIKGPEVTRLRFSNPRAGVVQSASLSG